MSKCIGCGVELQNVDKNKDGYVENLEFLICERCFTIKNYGQNKVVSKSNTDYMKILKGIKDDDIVIYVSSLLTLNLDYIRQFKNVILVLTKRDILPKSIKDSKIISYVKARYENISDVVVVSAYTRYNLDVLYNKLLKFNHKKIYFVGITNSGKSTLINSLVESYNKVTSNITTSNYPATTLDIVDVRIGKLKIKDTPGMLIDNSIVNYLDNNGIKKINSKKEIKPITFQIKGKGAIIWDEYIRIEYETIESSMTFYVSNFLNVDGISLHNPRLASYDYKCYDVPDNSDIVIEDMGFIKVTNKTKIKVYVKDDIYVYIRDKLI